MNIQMDGQMGVDRWGKSTHQYNLDSHIKISMDIDKRLCVKH